MKEGKKLECPERTPVDKLQKMLKPENSSSNRDSNQHPSIGGKLGNLGVALTQKNCVFYAKKGAGYANLKMLCVYSMQKTVTLHIKMRLVFSFFCTQQRRFVVHLPWV